VAKLTVQFSEEGTRALDELARKVGTTKTDVLRRALALYDYVERELEKDDGRNLSITDSSGAPIKDIVLH